MKDKIVNVINELNKLGLDTYADSKIKDLLIEVAQHYPNIAENQNILEQAKDIVEGIDNTVLIKLLELLRTSVSEEFAFEISKLFLLSYEMVEKYYRSHLAELKEVLSELAVPVIRVWKDILLCPLIGTLDSERAQTMAEKILQQASDTRSMFIIIDVTGISIIDTIVGGFLIELFRAIKLIGADVILTGIKPNIAHTLVKLGIDFSMVTVKRDLEGALRYAISRIDQNAD